MHKRASQRLGAFVPTSGSVETGSPLDTAWLVGVVPLRFVPAAIVLSRDEQLIYVAHADGRAVSVIDIASSSVTLQLRDCGSGPIALSPDGTLLYTAGRKHCYVIDTATHEVIDTIPAQGVNRIVCSPNGRFVSLSFSDSPDGIIRLVDRYDYASETDFDLGALGESSHVLAVSPDSTRIYAAVSGEEECRTLSVIDTAYYSQVDIPGLLDPQSLVPSPDGYFLYVGGRNGVYVADAVTHTVLCVVEFGMPGYAVEVIGITPDGHHVYAVHGCEGDLYRIDTCDRKATCVASLPAASSSALSVDGTRLYTAHSDLKWISLYAL